jgi:hypothetical protein
VVTYWLYYPYKPIIVKSIVIENPGKIVKAGELLTYRITYNKKMSITGKLTRKIIDGSKIDLPDSTASAPIGPDEDRISVKVPGYADAGKEYYMWWHVDYPVNPLRSIPVSVESDRFEVTK